MRDPRIAVRRDDEEGKWELLHPTAKRPIKFYNLATDLAQVVNLVASFPAPRDLPVAHAHHAQVGEMSRWLERP